MNDIQDEGTTLCDRCTKEVPMDHSMDGLPGTEWEDCILCLDCFTEVDNEEITEENGDHELHNTYK